MNQKFREIRASLRFLFPRVWLMAGVEKRSGKRLSLIWIGQDEQQQYILDRIFGSAKNTIELLGRRPILLLGLLQKKCKCPLAIVAAPGHVLSWIRSETDISVPWWIDSGVALRGDADYFKTKSTKSDYRRIKKYGLSYEVDNSVDQYKEFYERIYLPSIMTTHRGAALISSFDERLSDLLAGKAEILLIKMQEKTIGGLLLDYRQKVPALRDLGIVGGDKTILKTGVVAAAYVFSFQYLHSQGFPRVSLGSSRCFLDDGVLAYKRKWNPVLTKPSSEAFLYRVVKLNDPVRNVLCSSSCITERDGNLCFTFFSASDEDQRSNLAFLDQLAAIYGFSTAKHIDISGDHFREQQGSISETAPPD